MANETNTYTNIHHLHARAQDAASEERVGERAGDAKGSQAQGDGAAQPGVDIYAPEAYFNRELSWLDFNWRVLNEALDPGIPLLERLKFICITASNLDEFYMIRVAGLKQQIELEVTDLPPDGMTPDEVLQAVRSEVCLMNKAMADCFQQDIL
ncbi:MAG: hypothetical protein KFF77_08215, partial [Bacteroidetes bacterium]|nr:hypothetical protein [Bacteroidota bacterium]